LFYNTKMTDNIAESGKVPRNNSILFNEHSYHYPMIAITREELLCHEPRVIHPNEY
jgi:hypothetical protein